MKEPSPSLTTIDLTFNSDNKITRVMAGGKGVMLKKNAGLRKTGYTLQQNRRS